MARAIWPPFDAVLIPVPGLHAPDVMVASNLLMVTAFMRVSWLNFQMGRSWRSGVAQPGEAAPLITGHAFARCRHPMLAAVMAGQLGLFLAIPSLFTAICLVVGVATLLRQSDLEETDLATAMAITGPPIRRSRASGHGAVASAGGTEAHTRELIEGRHIAVTGRNSSCHRTPLFTHR